MKAIYTKDGGIAYPCPGCKGTHYIPVTGGEKWEFNWDLEHPTLSPSILEWHDGDAAEGIPAHRCHHFLRDGRIEFCGDSLHDLKGQTVDMPDVPAKWLEPKFMEMCQFTMERPK